MCLKLGSYLSCLSLFCKVTFHTLPQLPLPDLHSPHLPLALADFLFSSVFSLVIIFTHLFRFIMLPVMPLKFLTTFPSRLPFSLSSSLFHHLEFFLFLLLDVPTLFELSSRHLESLALFIPLFCTSFPHSYISASSVHLFYFLKLPHNFSTVTSSRFFTSSISSFESFSMPECR